MVAREKITLLDNLIDPAISLVNADDKLLRGLITSKAKNRKVLSYGIHNQSDFRATDVRLKGERIEFKVNSRYFFELPALGEHNIYNALAAIAVGRILGLSYSRLRSRLAAFKFPSGRLSLVERKGLRFIDDTYNSNPLSLNAALAALKSLKCQGRKILIMGDMLELGKQKELLHRQIAWSITNTCDLLITVGNLARITAIAARKNGLPPNRVFCCASANQAKDLLLKISAKPEDLILVKGSRSMKMEEVLGT